MQRIRKIYKILEFYGEGSDGKIKQCHRGSLYVCANLIITERAEKVNQRIVSINLEKERKEVYESQIKRAKKAPRHCRGEPFFERDKIWK